MPLRHAGAELAPQRTTRKMVFVLTDGEPSDIDVTHPQELVEDARRALVPPQQFLAGLNSPHNWHTMFPITASEG